MPRDDVERHLIAYALVNNALILLWGASGKGPFWPALSLLLWGLVLVAHVFRPHRPLVP
jgi:hypothetical protein